MMFRKALLRTKATVANARAQARSLWRSERGASLPLVAASILPMIAAVGSATDLGRIYVVKSQMQAGVDAAALAGARAFNNTDGTTSDRDHQVSAYFTGNFPDGYMGMPALTPTPKYETVSGVNVTTVSAQGDLPMAFMKIFGKASQTISVTAKASLQPRPLEVMVVLDNTGSMAGMLDSANTSMDALKTSMHNFITTLFQGSTTRSDLAMGIINYTITTNVGDILKKFKVSYNSVTGFTDQSWPTKPLGWKGCVADDATHVDMSTDLSVQETDAYDIQRKLPGESSMPAINPFFYPPVFTPQATDDSGKLDETGTYYTPRTSGMQVESANNLYTVADPNSTLNKPWFYRFYISLNGSSSGNSNDVIVTAKDNSFWDPNSSAHRNFDPTDPTTMSQYKVITSRIPHYTESNIWKSPTTYSIQVSKTNGDWALTPNPSPNFQCPEAGLEVAYGRTKATYDSFIDNKVAPVRPGNGTMHHIGFLWGYRLLVRDDVFTRSNPTAERPKRAIVFMTDGVTAFGQPTDTSQPNYLFADRNYTAYGSVADKKLVSTIDYGKFISAEELRFKKTCEAAKAETNPPLIFIVALNRGGNDMNANTRAMFQGCATGGYFETTSTSAINTAFTTIAQELVDLHLTQ
jgi:Flp pilus assembly protein TadG